MAGELERAPAAGSAGERPRPAIHVRTVVLQPRTALGKLALSAVLIAAGVLFFTVGIALAVGLAAAATVTGLGVVAYRAVTGRRALHQVPPALLDPSREVRSPARQE